MSPQAALQPYVRLQNLVTFLTEAQPAAEGAAPHLVDHVETAAATLWEQMKSAFSGEFEGTLTKMKWPSKDVNLAGRLKEEWTAGVEKLLDLQEPYVRSFLHGYNGSPGLVLYPRCCTPYRLRNDSNLISTKAHFFDHVLTNPFPLCMTLFVSLSS